jgi:lipopolysaccharide/colanic/teichoic acid biosynthesis glycosyltransferase
MFYPTIKRIGDITLSLILIIFFSPLLLIVAILIKISDGGEIFLHDPLRLGLNGKEFFMYKFRTMVPNAHQEIMENPKFKKEKRKWLKNGGKLRIKEDPRITWIGKILRSTDIDELPQLFNVLRGDMSLVGPRPSYHSEMVRFLKKYPEKESLVESMWSVRPGITGLWQISGRNDIPFWKRVELGSKYAQNYDLVLDLGILLQTPWIVVIRKGAYE